MKKKGTGGSVTISETSPFYSFQEMENNKNMLKYIISSDGLLCLTGAAVFCCFSPLWSNNKGLASLGKPCRSAGGNI